MAKPSPSAIPLYEALCKWGDPRHVSEMREWEEWGFSPLWLGDETEHDRKKIRHREPFWALERWLVERLTSGEFVSWGYAEDAPLEGIKPIPADVWRIAERDCFSSTITIGTKKIIGVVVCPHDTTQSVSTVRLVIKQKTSDISLDGRRADLSNRARALLIILAKAVLEGDGPISSSDLSQRLKVTSNVASQAVYSLRQRLEQQFGQGAGNTIENEPRRGYFLTLRPEEIQLQP